MTNEVITSRDNRLLREISRLVGSTHHRRRSGRTVLEGERLVQAFRGSIGAPEVLVLSESYAGRPSGRRILDETSGARVAVVADRLFRTLSDVEAPSGLLAVVAVPRPKDSASPGFMLMLHEVHDPGNLGTILRTSAAAGVDAVLLSPGCADAWSPKVLRAGMGAHFLVTLVEQADLAQAVREFGGLVVATAPTADRRLYDMDLSGPVSILMGGEARGLPDDLLQLADTVAALPMAPGVESLNVASAAAVCLFECVRQRGAEINRRGG